MPLDPPRYAVFVSPHGYGHAARASAVMGALHELNGARFEIFTTAPRWFFEESLAGTFSYHAVECDVGFRQASALRVDVPATLAALEAMVPFDQELVDGLATHVRELDCQAVLCDIAPLGVAVAERADRPSVLVENFSWSWLYERYLDECPGLRTPAEELARWRDRADLLVQTEPLCSRDEGVPLVDPISRQPRRERAEVRRRLGIDPHAPLVTVTMGGYPEALPFLERLRSRPEVTFLMTGTHEEGLEDNLVLVGNDTPIFMPDVLRASDAVVAKLGYGIIAEAWREGLPFAYVSRPGFPEMPPLEAFVHAEIDGFEIPSDDFAAGGWIDRIAELLALGRRPRGPGGAASVAELVGAL